MIEAYAKVGQEIDNGQHLTRNLRTLQKYRKVILKEKIPEGSPSVYYEQRERRLDSVNRVIEEKNVKRKKRLEKFLISLAVGRIIPLGGICFYINGRIMPKYQ